MNACDVKSFPTLHINFRESGLKGGNRVDGKEKKESSKTESEEKKEALRPLA
jgi:hypothetical protein